MSMIRRAALALAVSLAAAACGTLNLPEADVLVDGAPSGPCITHPSPGPGPFLQCPVAVELAAAKLNLMTETVSSVEFHLGVLCPPNARCIASDDAGTVVFWLQGAPPLMVRITPNGAGGFIANAAEVPPQWLLDQGPGGASAP